MSNEFQQHYARRQQHHSEPVSSASVPTVRSDQQSTHARNPSFTFPPATDGSSNQQEMQPTMSNPDAKPHSGHRHRRFFSRGRSKSPAPINTSAPMDATLADDPNNDSNMVASPTSMDDAGHNPLSSPTYTDSTGSTSSHKKRHSYNSRKTSGDHKRLSGTLNHCGRHGNDWLFGGFSVRESVRGFLKDGHESHHDSGSEGRQ